MADKKVMRQIVLDGLEATFEDSSYDECHGLVDFNWDESGENIILEENGKRYEIIIKEV